ncbi:MAG: hypothetical protein ACRDPY_32620 [Streptosporangiaceae bacterium]
MPMSESVGPLVVGITPIRTLPDGLDHSRSAEPLVASPEDHRHPACADLRLQPVPRHQRARPQARKLRREILAQHPTPASLPTPTPLPTQE